MLQEICLQREGKGEEIRRRQHFAGTENSVEKEEEPINSPFTPDELKRAICKTGNTSCRRIKAQHQICCILLRRLTMGHLALYNG